MHAVCIMSLMKLIVLLASLLSLHCCFATQGKQEQILIIALPQSSTEISTSWERGEEILPGALAAIEETKNYPSFASSNFNLVEADSSYDSPYSGNVLEVIANLAWEKKVSQIIGIAGVMHPKVLAVLDRFQLPIASLIHSNEVSIVNNSNRTLYYMTASTSTLVESILTFLMKVNPKKIGLITEIEQPYYLMVSKGILNAKISISLHETVQSHHKKSFSGIVYKIFASNIHVILLNVGPSTAISVLCEAYKSGLTWPKYAWILHSYRLDDLLQSSVQSNPGCNVQNILEGIFIFQLTSEEINFSSFSAKHIMNNSDPKFNPYAEVLYHSVWALISPDNWSSLHSNPVSSQFHFSPGDSRIYIYHNANNMATLVSTYDGKSHTLTNVSKINFRDSDLPLLSGQHRYLLPFLLLSFLSFLLNTVLLVLYVYFRNEPSVKSTSVSLSMLIFAGCYSNNLYIFCLILNRAYPTLVDLCMLGAWSAGTGLAVALIFATLLVKMLRVYHIFNTHKILKNSPLLSDGVLLFYTFLILVPSIIIHTAWTAIDPYRKVIHFTEQPGSITVLMNCHCKYTYMWFGLAISYIILLSIAVVIVAIKSRKIRHANFKDTKKVNLNIFLTLTVSTPILFYYLIFTISNLYSASFVVLYVVHLFNALLSQFTLLVPKLLPVLQTKVLKPRNILQIDYLHMTSLV